MAALRRISEGISNLWFPRRQDSTDSASATTNLYAYPPTPLKQYSQSVDNRFLRSGVTNVSRLNYNTFSAVDELIARSLSYDVENVDVDVSNIVQSIEFAPEEDHPTQDGPDEDDDEHQFRDRRDLLDQLHQGLDIRGKYRQQLADATRLGELGWSHDTILAYLKIARRGYEPLFPPNWRRDFPKFPLLLFAKDEGSSFIRPMQKSNFYALKAFDAFCMMGMSVRLAEEHHTGPHRSPEAMINKHIKDYLKWAWADAGLTEDVESGRIPCLLTVAKRTWKRQKEQEAEEQASEPFAEIEEKIRQKLEEASRNLLSVLRIEGSPDEYIMDPPTLFGLVIYETIVAVVAYEPLNPDGEIRQFAFYHFNKIQEEIWNSISLSILVSWVRNGMIRVKQVLDRIESAMEDDGAPMGGIEP
jgi:hypothetical protein